MITGLFVGLVAGGLVVAVIWWLDSHSYITMLVRKAQPETRAPVSINGRHYFVVPAREFVAMKARAMVPHSYLSDTGD